MGPADLAGPIPHWPVEMRSIAALLVLAALGSVGAASGTPTGGLRGLVTKGPTTPVCRAGERLRCPGGQYEAALLPQGRTGRQREEVSRGDVPDRH